MYWLSKVKRKCTTCAAIHGRLKQLKSSVGTHSQNRAQLCCFSRDEDVATPQGKRIVVFEQNLNNA